MKTRNGFVSNSSSSSFLVSVPHISCKHCNHADHLIQIINNLFHSKWKDLYISGNRDDYVVKIDDELEAINNDIVWASYDLQALEKILQNEDAINLFSQWYAITDNASTRHRRFMDEHKDPVEKINGAINRQQHNITNLRKKINDLKEKRQLILSKTLEGQEVYSFEMDVMSNEYKIMEQLIEDGSVELIEKITS